MRKFWIAFVLTGMALALGAPVLADQHENGDIKWSLEGEVRARGDSFENYDFDGTTDDDFGIWPYTMRLGVDAMFGDDVHAMIEFRNDSTFGNSPTFNEAMSSPQFPFSGSPAFFAVDQSDDVDVYQAFVDVMKIGGSDFSFRVGRQEYTLGTELLIGNNDFYTGQSYDGVRLMWNQERWDVEGFYFKIAELNVNPDLLFLDGGSLDTNLYGVTFDYKFEGLGQLDVYYLVYQALDDVGSIPPFLPGGSADTVGVRYGKMVMEEGDGSFDWNIEYADQSGDYDDPAIDLAGDVIEGWFGYNLWTGNARHRFHIGYLNASGDDPATADDEGFFPMFTDPHAYNRLGNLDMYSVSDIEDINLGYDIWFGDDGRHHFYVALHQLALDQAVPVAVGTEDDLGLAWDLNYAYQMNQYLAFEANVSSNQTGDLQEASLGADAKDAKRYYGQLSVRW